jgi:hypothetical protein
MIGHNMALALRTTKRQRGLQIMPAAVRGAIALCGCLCGRHLTMKCLASLSHHLQVLGLRTAWRHELRAYETADQPLGRYQIRGVAQLVCAWTVHL